MAEVYEINDRSNVYEIQDSTARQTANEALNLINDLSDDLDDLNTKLENNISDTEQNVSDISNRVKHLEDNSYVPHSADFYESNLPIEFEGSGNNVIDWRIDGNNNFAAEALTDTLPIQFYNNGDNLLDFTIYGNENGIGENGVIPIDIKQKTNNLVNEFRQGGYDDRNKSATDQVCIKYAIPCKHGDVFHIGYFGNKNDLMFDVYALSDDGLEQYNTDGMITTSYYAIDTTSHGADINYKYTALNSSIYDIGGFVLVIRNTEGSISVNDVYNYITVIKGDIDLTEYIPYYYTKHIEINIENPLTQNQLITKQEANVNIDLFKGENIIDTTLTNKPKMKISYLGTDTGVGERTKNYINVETGTTSAGITFTVDPTTKIVTANGTATGTAQLRIAINAPEELNNTTVPPGNYYFSGTPSGGSGASYNCYSWDTDTGARSKQWDNTTNSETDLGQGSCQVQINGNRQNILLRIAQGYTADNVVFKPMLRRADTSPDFEPYGYKIPIDIKQNNEIISHKDIYIGNTRLTEGNSISKQDTNQEITTVLGNNIIDTISYNKPNMYILPSNDMANTINKLNNINTYVNQLEQSIQELQQEIEELKNNS